jgi:O-antigen/teichoic acid export membrane protein
MTILISLLSIILFWFGLVLQLLAVRSFMNRNLKGYDRAEFTSMALLLQLLAIAVYCIAFKMVPETFVLWGVAAMWLGFGLYMEWAAVKTVWRKGYRMAVLHQLISGLSVYVFYQIVTCILR